MSTRNNEVLQELKSQLEELSTIVPSQDQNFLQKIAKCQQHLKHLTTIQNGVLTKFNLTGQIALVTGGGRGIGRQLALGLGEAGCKVAIADIEPDRLQNVVEELKAKGIECIGLQVDVSKKEDCVAMIQKILETWGNLHIACNNAGIVDNSASEETSQTEWDRTIGINLSGVFYCCQAQAAHMLQNGYGRIINTASICAKITTHPQTQVAYNAAKAGVLHLTKSLGAEWASRGITVNCISPGYIDTPLLQSPALRDLKLKWINDTPMGRLGQVTDLVGAVIYLASPLSNFMTGNDLVIDGGFTCW